MVKIVPTLLALSASLTVAFAHSGHTNFSTLEKRATEAPEPKGCAVTYAGPVAAGAYPVIDCIPFTADPQVQAWLKLVDMTKVPVYPLSNDGLCPTNLATLPADQCWWTCQKCEAPADITSCPTPGTWGLTYDDGPSPDSPRLYDYLKAHNQKATLFVVGSRAISWQATLKRAYAEGHQIAIHTWSHQMMTSLSNAQIVAELKWTEKAIHDIIGVTPNYWRPPYGDVDNRVRAIATQLGYKTSIWTQTFDTNDWSMVPPGTATPQSVIATFQSWLSVIPTMKTGFIVLEHDLFPQEVDVSTTGILPLAYQDKALTIVPIAQCKQDATPYKEGAGTFVLQGPALPQSSGGSGAAPSGGASTTAPAPGGPTVIGRNGAGTVAVSASLSAVAAALAVVSYTL
ncbi:chitin deacetylase [Gryganskiella cystojenkinii]|nr:chitin deacetylase [Gryganskiella cystojenkinii]